MQTEDLLQKLKEKYEEVSYNVVQWRVSSFQMYSVGLPHKLLNVKIDNMCIEHEMLVLKIR